MLLFILLYILSLSLSDSSSYSFSFPSPFTFLFLLRSSFLFLFLLLYFNHHSPQGPFVQYLHIPGSLGQFLGFWKIFANAAYSYSGIETIATAAAETKNPRRNIPKAAKRIFFISSSPSVCFPSKRSVFLIQIAVPPGRYDRS